MQIRSAKTLSSDNCIALVVYVLLDKEKDEYLSTFELVVPDDEIDLAQYDAVLEGLSFAEYKVNSLLEDLEDLDYEDDDEDEAEDDE